jgi:uncharacterized membrane protein YgdD (TMEM256/DUF423 family)
MSYFDKKIVIFASILAAITIGIGAFGAHGLKDMVDAQALLSFETGVRYLMYHVLALLIIGLTTRIPYETKKWVFRFFIIGMLFFSGSIFLLSMKSILPFSISFLGPVTPIGGLMLMVGWLRLAYGLLTIEWR